MTGLLAAPDRLADRFVEVLGDPALRERLGAAALRRARTLTWDASALGVTRVFHRVVTGRSPRPASRARGSVRRVLTVGSEHRRVTVAGVPVRAAFSVAMAVVVVGLWWLWPTLTGADDDVNVLVVGDGMLADARRSIEQRVREAGLSIEWYEASDWCDDDRPAGGRVIDDTEPATCRGDVRRRSAVRRGGGERRSAAPTSWRSWCQAPAPTARRSPRPGSTPSIRLADRRARRSGHAALRVVGAAVRARGHGGSRRRRHASPRRAANASPGCSLPRSEAIAVRSSAVRTVVVLPTYNEVENIGAMLAAVRTAVPSADIIVVDDNSPDGTAAVAETVAAELGQIKLLHRPGKHGLGSAYRNGFTMALDEGYDRIVSMDVDFSHDPAVIPEMLRLIDAGAAAVIGSRYVPGGSTVNWSPHRRLLSRWGNRYTSFVLRLQIRDCTSGFRAYRADALRRDLAVDHDRRGLRVPHRARAAPRARRVQGDGDADRVPRPRAGHLEDVGPHRRRVDAARHPLGPARPR